MNKKLIYGFIALNVFFLSWWFLSKSPTTPVSPKPSISVNSVNQDLTPAKPVTVVIDFGNSLAVTGEVVVTNALEALEKTAWENGLELQTKTYDFGILVEKIGDIKNSSKKAWIYFVNGQSGQIAADKMPLNAGDSVEWKYIEVN